MRTSSRAAGQNGGRNVYVFSRGNGAGIVVVDTAGRTGPMRIPVHGIADGTTLVDELGDGAPAQVVITGGVLAVDLPTRSAAIYRIAP
jgi:hypothetical protein